jgi:HK97 family phage prohead protease
MMTRLKMGQPATYYRSAAAWVDPEGDAKTKAAYKFMHHDVAGDGTVGAANIAACQAVIGILNGARGGSNIPAADKQGVWNHVAKHLRDAKLFPAPLKAAEPDEEMKSLVRRFEIKAVDEATRTFEGLVAAYSLDQGGDIILPGAFKRTLSDWKGGKGRIVPLIDSHGRDSIRRVVGKLLEAKEVDGEGLWTRHDIIEGPDGDEIYRRVKGGKNGPYVDGLSIGYRAIQIKMPTPEEERTGIWRYLKEVQLREDSLVIEAMNQDARVDPNTVKAADREAVRRLLAETFSAEDIEALKATDPNLRALLDTQPADTPDPGVAAAAKELAPDDPRRIALDERLRDLNLRSLGIG